MRVSLSLVQFTHTGHLPGKPGKVNEFKTGQGKVRGKGKIGEKLCSCMWSITASIVHDIKYARKEFFTR